MSATLQLPDGQVRVELPSGDRVWYDDESHGYFRCKPDGSRGKRLTGVTTVCKTLDHDSSRLLAWAARTQLIGVAELARREQEWDGWLESEDTIQQALEQHRLTFEDVRDEAGARGNLIHVNVFQELAAGRDPLDTIDLDMLTLDERMGVEGALAFWRDEQPEPVLVEQVVYSERLGVAGRLDFYGTIAGRDGTGLIDWKSGRYLGASAHCQTGGGYPLLLEESGWPNPEWAVMVRVADGGYEVIESQGTPADFEAAVAAYRAATRINTAAARARRAAA